MSSLVQLQPSPHAWVIPDSKPLDEAVWRAWVSKGQARDARGSAARLKAIEWVSAATLVAATARWTELGSYSMLVQFVVMLGSFAAIVHCFRIKQYALVAVFGVLALLYNPVAPLISFVGDWQRAFVLGSAAPFIIAAGAVRTARKESI